MTFHGAGTLGLFVQGAESRSTESVGTWNPLLLAGLDLITKSVYKSDSSQYYFHQNAPCYHPLYHMELKCDRKIQPSWGSDSLHPFELFLWERKIHEILLKNFI